MLVIQQNCGKRYKYTISTLKVGLGLNAKVVYIQEPFLRKKNLAYLGFSLYWPVKTHDCKDNRVFIAVQKDLLNIKIVENRTNLIVAPPTQGTWRSDDYVNAFRLVDIVVVTTLVANNL